MVSCAACVAREALAAQAGKKPKKGLLADEELLKGLEIDGEEDSWEEVVEGEEDEEEDDDEGRAEPPRERKPSQQARPMSGVESGLAELDMDAYDDEDDEGAFVNSVYGGKRPGGALYRDSAEDPHLDDDQPSSDSEDENDMVLRASDHMILAAKNEEDLSQVSLSYEAASESNRVVTD